MPGWTVDAQETTDADVQTTFWQFHYPVLDVTELNCSVRSQGHTNPGGEYTMCGSDLQAYIDSIMPPPDTGQIALTASADSTLHRGRPNTNDGSNPVLGLGGGRNAREIVLSFSPDRILQLLGDGELIAATLRLSQVGKHGRTRLAIRPLTGPFAQGNGNLAERTGAWARARPGTAPRTPTSATMSRSACSAGRGRPSIPGQAAGGTADRTVHHDWRNQQVSWDVSEDVRSDPSPGSSGRCTEGAAGSASTRGKALPSYLIRAGRRRCSWSADLSRRASSCRHREQAAVGSGGRVAAVSAFRPHRVFLQAGSSASAGRIGPPRAR